MEGPGGAGAGERGFAADPLDLPKSQVVREALSLYGEHLGRLTDEEREIQLAACALSWNAVLWTLDQAHVPRSKPTHYLLSLDHPAGRTKAACFVTRGFSPGRPELLRAAILEVARSGRVGSMTETPWGTKYYVEGWVQAPDGNRVGLATVWMVTGRGAPTLVTAYPRREPRR